VGIPNANADGLMTVLDQRNTVNGATMGLSSPALTRSTWASASMQAARSQRCLSPYEVLAFMATDWQTFGVDTTVRVERTRPSTTEPRTFVQDSPSWWHAGHQARKFKSGEISIDAHRMTARRAATHRPQDRTTTQQLQTRAFNTPVRDYCGSF